MATQSAACVRAPTLKTQSGFRQLCAQIDDGFIVTLAGGVESLSPQACSSDGIDLLAESNGCCQAAQKQDLGCALHKQPSDTTLPLLPRFHGTLPEEGQPSVPWM